MPLQIARLIGSAGSGKTTALLDIMTAALERLGGDPLRLGLATFTRPARAEAVERAAAAWGVDQAMLARDGWFRTVHSIAYRCLGITGGRMLSGSDKDMEWLSNAIGVNLRTSLDDESGRQKFFGDNVGATALNCWDLARVTLTDLGEVVRRLRASNDRIPEYAEIVRKADRYETAKRADDRLDFTDLLMRFAGYGISTDGTIHRRRPEGDLPEVAAWLFDEQQDASPLLDAACRRLIAAPSVQWCYVVGDPFQAIYGFAGSSADCFLAWPAQKEKIMPKSYRCPRPILELGERCLRRMNKGYFDRGTAPADHHGTVSEINTIEDVVDRVCPDESWLLIARSNYQATRLFAAMSQAGKPARWTTAAEGRNARTHGLVALWSLERGEPITGQDWARALELLPSKSTAGPMLARGTKTKWKQPATVEHWDRIFPGDLPDIGATDALAAMIRSGDWVKLVDHGATWRRQAAKWGADLAAEPKTRVGTIHSVKGSEADNVALLTTTSRVVEHSKEDLTTHDEECRLAYVGVTRARRNLYVINEGKFNGPRLEVL